MNNKTEQYSNNGWQNIGICSIFAEERIQYSKIPLYMHLVRRSFGYCERKTNRISQLEMSKKLKIDKKTLIAHMKYLIENEFVEVVHSKDYVDGGGSESYAYAPCYPTGFGAIKFKDEDNKSGSKVKKEDSIKTKEPEKEVKSNMIYVEGKDYDF